MGGEEEEGPKLPALYTLPILPAALASFDLGLILLGSENIRPFAQKKKTRGGGGAQGGAQKKKAQLPVRPGGLFRRRLDGTLSVGY